MSNFCKFAKGSNFSVPDSEWFANSLFTFANKLCLTLSLDPVYAFAEVSKVLFVYLQANGFWGEVYGLGSSGCFVGEYCDCLRRSRLTPLGRIFFSGLAENVVPSSWTDMVWERLNDEYAVRKSSKEDVRHAFELAFSMCKPRRTGSYYMQDAITRMLLAILEPLANDSVCVLSTCEPGSLRMLSVVTSETENCQFFVPDISLVAIARLGCLLYCGKIPEIRDESALLNENKKGLNDVVICFPPIGRWLWPPRGIFEKIARDYGNWPVQLKEESYFDLSISLLREGGRLAIMMPSSFLRSSKSEGFRLGLLRRVGIVAIAEFGKGVLRSSISSLSNSLLVAQKRVGGYDDNEKTVMLCVGGEHPIIGSGRRIEEDMKTAAMEIRNHARRECRW